MKTLTYIAIALFTAYFFRIEIAKYQVHQMVATHRDEIQFVGSLMPVLCQFDKVQNAFKNNSGDFTAFAATLQNTTQYTLPALDNAIENIVPYNEESRELKKSVRQLYQTSANQTAQLHSVVSSWQNSDGFWSMVLAGYQTYQFASDLERSTKRINHERLIVEQATQRYIHSLTQDLGRSVAQNEWLVVVYKRVLTNKDKAVLKNYVTEQVFAEINSTTYLQSGCAREQLLLFKKELGL